MYEVKFGMFKWDGDIKSMQPGKTRRFGDDFMSALAFFLKKERDVMCDWVTISLNKTESR